MDRTLLEKKSVAELREIGAALGMRGLQRLKKADLVERIVNSASEAGPATDGQGQGAGAEAAPAQEAASSSGAKADASRASGATTETAPATGGPSGDGSAATGGDAGDGAAAPTQERGHRRHERHGHHERGNGDRCAAQIRRDASGRHPADGSAQGPCYPANASRRQIDGKRHDQDPADEYSENADVSDDNALA